MSATTKTKPGGPLSYHRESRLNAEIGTQIQESDENPVVRIDSQKRFHYYYVVPKKRVQLPMFTLRTVSRRVIPACFVMLFLLTGTVFLVYMLVLHQGIPRIALIAVSIAFGGMIVLFLITFLTLYLREWQIRRRAEIEIRGYSRFAKARNESREWIMGCYRKIDYECRRFFQKSTAEHFLERFQEKWYTWVSWSPTLPDADVFRRISTRHREGPEATPAPPPAPLRGIYKHPTVELCESGETSVTFPNYPSREVRRPVSCVI